MSEQVNLNVQVLDSEGRDVTGTMPFFQDIPLNGLSVKRVANLPGEDAEFPNYMLILQLASEVKEQVRETPTDATPPSTKQTPEQRRKALGEELTLESTLVETEPTAADEGKPA